MVSEHTTWQTYRESVTMLDKGLMSESWVVFSESRSHNSSFVSSEKSESTAPARVPVATRGLAMLVDHAKAAVRGICRIRPISRDVGRFVWKSACCTQRKQEKNGA